MRVTRNQITAFSLAACLLAPLAAQAPPSVSQAPVSWQTWLARNRPVLETRPRTVTSLRSALAHQPRFLRPAAGHGAPRFDADDLLRLGLLGEPADVFTLTENVRLPGRRGQAAILGLGLFGRRAAIGHLSGLFRDDVVGRALAGDARRAVPLSHRVAAAVALGLTGAPRAHQALRLGLKDVALPDSLGAAVIVALSFSGSPGDGVRFEHCLRKRRDRPLMREAAAAGLGRHLVHVPGARRLLVRVLEQDPAAGGRGAAVALWFRSAGEEDAGETAALERAARSSRDPVTRLLASLTLAARGEPGAEAVIEELLAMGGAERGYALLAAGLLGRARPELADRTAARLRRLAPLAPDAARAAEQLLLDKRLRPRPEPGRTLAHVAGGNASFRGARFLEAVLDLAAGLVR